MNLDEIEKIIAMFEKASISSLEVEVDGARIRLTKELAPVAVTVAAPVNAPVAAGPVVAAGAAKEPEGLAAGEDYVKSPLVGTYHQAAYQDAKPYVTVGSKVKKGDTLCIVEAMKVMNEIKAPRDGTIKSILVEEGGIVEYDQNLFVLGA